MADPLEVFDVAKQRGDLGVRVHRHWAPLTYDIAGIQARKQRLRAVLMLTSEGG